MYHRGSRKEFEAWDKRQMAREGIPPGGRPGRVGKKHGKSEGRLVTDKYLTTSYSACFPHPDDENDVVWSYGKYPVPNKDKLNPHDLYRMGFKSRPPRTPEEYYTKEKVSLSD